MFFAIGHELLALTHRCSLSAAVICLSRERMMVFSKHEPLIYEGRIMYLNHPAQPAVVRFRRIVAHKAETM